MSLLPCATFAGPSQAEALWAVAGSVGPGGGVTQLVAGANITLDPPTGEGVVTINASGGGGGSGVTEILSGGAGLGVSNPTGAVTLTNTGVTEIVAGSGITASGTTGAVTLTAVYAPLSTLLSASLSTTGSAPTIVTQNNIVRCVITTTDAGSIARGYIKNLSWDTTKDSFFVTVRELANGYTGNVFVQCLPVNNPNDPQFGTVAITVFGTVAFGAPDRIAAVLILTRLAGVVA